MNQLVMRRREMSLRLLSVFLLSFTTSILAEENSVDPAEFNQRIKEATATGEEWAGDPSQIAATLVGPWLAPGKEMSSQRREISAASSGEDPTTGITVVLKEDGLFDDATRRIDHRFSFSLVGGVWTITDASVKYHDARPAFPFREEENTEKAKAGMIILQQQPVAALEQAASEAGITDLPSTIFATLEGDPEAFNAFLKLSTKVGGYARQDYARLLFGMSCFFEKPGFNRYLFMNLDEKTSMTVREILRQIDDGELP